MTNAGFPEGAGAEYEEDRARLERLLRDRSGPPQAQAHALLEFATELLVAARNLDFGQQASTAALQRLEQEEDTDFVLRSYAHMQVGGLALIQGDQEQARLHVERMRHFAEIAGESEAQTQAEMLLANLAQARGDLAQAQQHWGQVLRLSARAEDVDQQAAANWFIGMLAVDQGKLAEARRHVEQVLALTENPLLLGGAELLLGGLARRHGNLAKAKQHARRSVELAEAANSVLGRGDSCLFAAQLSRDEGNLAEAQRLAEQALNLAEAAGDELEPEESLRFLSQAHCVAGTLARERGDLTEGQRLAEKALELAETAGSRGMQADAHDLLALIAGHEWGDLSRARQHAERALELAEATGDVLQQSRAQNKLGELAGHQSGDLTQAREQVQRALQLAEAAEDVFEQAHDHAMLGEIARVQGDPSVFEEHVKQALELAEAVHHRVGQGNAHHLLAELHYQRGQVPQAREHLEQALSLAKSAGDTPEQSKAHLMLGDLARLRHEYPSACNHAQKALELAAEAGDDIGAAKAHVVLSNTLVADSPWELATALKHMMAAIRTRERVRLRVGSSADRARILADSADWDQVALSQAASLGDGWAGLELAEIGRGEALAQLLHSRGTYGDAPEPVRALLHDLDEVHSRRGALLDPRPIADERVIDPGLLRARKEAQEELDERIAQLHRELATAVGSAFQRAFTAEPIAADSLRARLRGNVHALLLRLFPLPHGEGSGGRLLYSVWVPPEPTKSPVIEEKELTAEQVNWLTDLTSPRDAHLAGWRLLEDTGHRWRRELGECLLPAELRTHLSELSRSTEGEPPTLLIVPSGELWGLPFATLDVSGRCLLDLAALTLLPALRMLPETPPLRQPHKDGGGSAQALAYITRPDAQAERDQLAHDYGSQLDVETDPQQLVTKLRNGDRYQLGVLSVHGDAELGLAHSIELQHDPPHKLSAARLLGLSLPPRLVIGACWSTRVSSGPGEEPIGLPTVALTRGATSLTTALYPVPDKATGTILAAYYQQLAAGVPPVHALRNAQRGYIAAAQHDDSPDWELGGTPGYWAGLTLLTIEPGLQGSGDRDG
ncbi:tetratricopeptide repeat protein [Streptomyces sp. NBC_01262]|uniref:tetratricopeptide repeat protein n=1 Tax=Streptomyces sp. NBC_01262 TaxID=2903803 RepID=UPI002E337F9B|nr:tetratricopeptide repeat protein [Streptomyces sp. NBC_01262]